MTLLFNNWENMFNSFISLVLKYYFVIHILLFQASVAKMRSQLWKINRQLLYLTIIEFVYLIVIHYYNTLQPFDCGHITMLI